MLRLLKKDMDGNYIFHVHSWRCGHAENISDEAYIKKAISLNASSIYFTDHAPFPGDPFGHRMKYEQLKEYIDTLKTLKIQYKDIINVYIGLEIEYLPSFSSYYYDLKSNNDLDLLVLGQHISELSPGHYSFMDGYKYDTWKILFEGLYEGTKTKLFDVVVHPDRVYKNENSWTFQMNCSVLKYINLLKKINVPIEKNLASIRSNGLFRPEFWKLVPDNYPIVVGCDAHFLDELKVIF